MAALSINNMMQYFQFRIQQAERGMGIVNIGVGDQPEYPVLITFLGENNEDAFLSAQRDLMDLWPMYKDELIFLSVEPSKEDKGTFSYYALKSIVPEQEEQEKADKEAVSKEQLPVLCSRMFEADNHFNSKAKQLLYFILDTSAIQSIEDFDQYLKEISALKKATGLPSSSIADLLIVLLDESLSMRLIAGQIRNRLAEYYTENGELNVGGILVLSNMRSDFTLLDKKNRGVLFQIIADTIALSDGQDGNVSHHFFSRNVMTISYAREEKPLSDISQVMVETIIDRLQEMQAAAFAGINFQTLPQDLGVNKDGRLDIVDAYVRKDVLQLLPDRGQLEAFPRKDTEKEGYLADMSFQELDDYTMGAWSCYLSSLTKDMVASRLSTKLKNEWKQQYGTWLENHFSISGLIWLENNPVKVHDILERDSGYTSSQNIGALTDAEGRLFYQFSVNKEIIHLFEDVIREKGEQAGKFTNDLKQFVESRKRLFPIKDDTIVKYYSRIVNNYFDQNSAKLSGQLQKVHSMADLSEMIRRIINELIESDSVFTADFASELATRMNALGIAFDPRQYFHRKLIEGPITYYRTAMALDSPLISNIFVDKQSSLYPVLQDILPKNFYYYDTWENNAAGNLTLYRLDATHLVNDEGAQ